MDPSHDRIASLSRRHKRIQQLAPDEGVRRSPRISRSGARPFYGTSRGSRESSTASDDGRINRLSPTISEVMNESGQLMYDGIEFEESDVHVTTPTPMSRVSPSLSWKATLPRIPRPLNSVDSGVSSLSGGSSDELRQGSPGLPRHLYGLDDDVQVTLTTQYVYTKENILTPPKASPQSPAVKRPNLITRLGLRLFSLPYFLVVSLITFDVFLLNKLSSFLAVLTNPVERRKSWFGLVILVSILLLLTWYLANPAPPSPTHPRPPGMSQPELQLVEAALRMEMQEAVETASKAKLMPLVNGISEVNAIVSILVESLREARSDVDQLSQLSKLTDEHADDIVKQLKSLEAHLQTLDQSTSADLAAIQERLARVEKDSKDHSLQVKNALSDLKKEIASKVDKAQVMQIMDELMAEWMADSSSALQTWLQSHLDRTALQEEVDRLRSSLEGRMKEEISSRSGMPKNEVEKLIKAKLDHYSADKTGMFDYALSTAGGTIPTSYHSPPFNSDSTSLKLFGYPVWHVSNSPSTVIQPGMMPGQCWAFAGEEGYIVLQLSADITLTHITLEHIPSDLSPSGKIDSAPKKFGVLVSAALEEEREELKNMTYTGEDAVLTVPVEYSGKTVRFVEFRFYENHQSPFTCVYRLRVHGTMIREKS